MGNINVYSIESPEYTRALNCKDLIYIRGYPGCFNELFLLMLQYANNEAGLPITVENYDIYNVKYIDVTDNSNVKFKTSDNYIQFLNADYKEVVYYMMMQQSIRLGIEFDYTNVNYSDLTDCCYNYINFVSDYIDSGGRYFTISKSKYHTIELLSNYKLSFAYLYEEFNLWLRTCEICSPFDKDTYIKLIDDRVITLGYSFENYCGLNEFKYKYSTFLSDIKDACVNDNSRNKEILNLNRWKFIE